jgi:hypothetical protein
MIMAIPLKILDTGDIFSLLPRVRGYKQAEEK